MSIPMYGQNTDGGLLGDWQKMMDPDFSDNTNLRRVKQTFYVTGGVTTEVSIPISENATCYGGYIEIDTGDAAAGTIDCDLGLTTGAGGFGTAYGDKGDGVYAFRATEFISVGSEKFFLSFDANSLASTKTAKITVCALIGLCLNS